MAQKNATPNKEQASAIERQGLRKAFWVVVKEFEFSMIIKNRVTGEFKVIQK